MLNITAASTTLSRTSPHHLTREVMHPIQAMDVIAQYAKGNEQNGTLDFTKCDAQALERLAPHHIEIAAEVKATVTAIQLPPYLQCLPKWVAEFPSLARLSILQYKSVIVDFKKTGPLTLEINGPNVNEVHVNQNTYVYWQNKLLRPNTVNVHVYDDDGMQIRTETVTGHRYYAARTNPDTGKRNWIDTTNLNGEATFPDKSSIVCRHLALNEIAARQTKMSSAHRADQRAQEMGSVDLLSQHMSPRMEAYFQHITRYATQTYLVGHSHLDNFINDQFSSLSVGSRQSMLWMTGNHAMSIEWKVVSTPEGKRKEICNFYDPNSTLTHLRIVTDPLKREPWKVESFLGKEDIDFYYGNIKNPRGDQVSCFQLVPEDFSQKSHIRPVLSDAKVSRAVTFYLSEQEKTEPILFFHLLCTGLPLTEVITFLAQYPASVDEMYMLVAKRVSSTLGFFLALGNGETETIKVGGEILLMMCQEGWLRQKELIHVLAAREEGIPGFSCALANGHTETVIAFGEILLKAYQKAWLTQAELMDLLAAKDRDGIPGFWFALVIGRTETVKAFRDILWIARKEGWLTQEGLMHLLGEEMAYVLGDGVRDLV